jgi:hypothetical protein
LEIVFTDGSFWRKGAESAAFPMGSTPLVEQTAKRVTTYAWSSFGHDAGLNLIRLTFVRMRKEHYLDVTKTTPVQEASAMFTREQLETGDPKFILAIAQREGGTWERAANLRLGPGERPVMSARDRSPSRIPASTKRVIAPALGFIGAAAAAIASAALVDSIRHDMGEHPIGDVALKGRDTIDVHLYNPQFWAEDDTLKSFPEESLPAVRAMAVRGVGYMWRRYAQKSAINVIRVTFHRDYWRLEDSAMRKHPAQEVIAQYTRQQMEKGPLDSIPLTTIQRDPAGR